MAEQYEMPEWMAEALDVFGLGSVELYLQAMRQDGDEYEPGDIWAQRRGTMFGLERLHAKGLLAMSGEGVEVTILSTGVNFVGITRQAHKMREGEPWLKVDGKGKHRVFARPVEGE